MPQQKNTIRLMKAAKEFCKGKSQIIEFLESVGYCVDNKPDPVLTEEMYDALIAEYEPERWARIKNERESVTCETDGIIDGKTDDSDQPTHILLPLQKSETHLHRRKRIPLNVQDIRIGENSHENGSKKGKEIGQSSGFIYNVAEIYTLGKVIFFDHKVNNFGFVHGLEDAIECRIWQKDIITPPVFTDEIVFYQKRKKGKEKFEAYNLSNIIPVFIFNKESEGISFAFPIINNLVEKEISLWEKYETGFALVKAKYKTEYWEVVEILDDEIHKPQTISCGREILKKLVTNLYENINSIEWLILSLQAEFEDYDLNAVFRAAILYWEQHTINQIGEEIVNIKNNSVLQTFIEERKSTLNKISFVLWQMGEIERLPLATKQSEVDIWRNEILLELEAQTAQQVVVNLLFEQGGSKQVEESYKFLISQGWEINNENELEHVISFLEEVKPFFPFIEIRESNLKCSENQYYIELYKKGLVSDLSDLRIRNYLELLSSDEEKAGFIEKLPSNKILSYYFSFPSLSKFQEKYIAGVLEGEFSKIDFLCFDLESDGEKIYEFAWKSRLGEKSERDFKEPKDGIAELVSLINSSSLIIGQNIKEFDLSVLSNHGASPSSDIIWDTLVVEMLLNPARFSYGLSSNVIQHSALSDTEATYRLFKNQSDSPQTYQ